MKSLRQGAICLATAGLLLATFGCGSGTDPDAMFAEATSSNIRRLAKMYSLYTTNNNWTGPADKQTLVAFIKQQSPARLEKMGIDSSDVDSLFICERDNQEFKIRWAMKDKMYGPPLPIIFESAGVDGQYMVGYTGNTIKTVAKSEYDQLWTKDYSSETTDPADAGNRRR